MTAWTEKHRPKTLDDIVGNPTAVAELRKWAEAWQRGRPEKRAVVLQGDPGVGKTSAALALANEMGWSIVEMNASDSRNAEAIRKVATRGAVLQTFSDTGEFLETEKGGRKLIVLDEADNIFGREDKGGVAAIVEMIQKTQQPVVLIVNDYYALTRRSSSLKRLCKTIKFQGIHDDAMKNILRTIAEREGLEAAPDVLDVIVERASGDLRSAINDLESIAIGRKEVRAASTKSLGYRDRELTIFPVIEEILRSGDARRAREAVRDLDETPEDLILWIDQNLAHEFPYYLIQMARSRAQRGARNSVASKFARYLHASQSLVRTDVLPVLKALFAGDEELRIQLTAELGLDEREVAFLLDEAEASHAVKHLLEKAAKIAHPKAREAAAGRLHAFDEGETDDA